MITKYGYARVSSESQRNNSSLDSQKDKLIQAGIPKENIRVEVGSGTNEIRNRPVFQILLEKELKSGDILMVTELDRCSRNTLEFLKLQDILFKRGITFISLDLPNSTDLATNKLIATSLSAIATFENERRKERQRMGIEAAKHIPGKYTGRKTVINKTLIEKVRKLKEKSGLGPSEIAKLTSVSRTTIYKVLKDHLGYVSNRLVKLDTDNENSSNN